MNKGNLWLRLLGVAALCVLFGIQLWPPERSLKLGIDLDGGYSLLYEIDDAGLAEHEKADLADRVIEILRKRVDPDSVRNLIWRAIGNNRIEIQMPRPSEDILEGRAEFDAALGELEATNVTVSELYAILAKSPDQRQEEFDNLIRYAPQRQEPVRSLVQAHDARMAAQQASSQPAVQQARTQLDQAIDGLLATNFPLQKLMDALEVGAVQRGRVVSEVKAQYPQRAGLVDALAAAYDGWAKVKSGLDDPSDLRRLLRGAGVLEFRILAKPSDPEVAQAMEQLKERGPRIRKGDAYGWFLIAKPEEFTRTSDRVIEKYAEKSYVLGHLSPDRGLIAGGGHAWKLVRANVRYDLQNAGYAVDFQLDEYGGQLFYDLTSRHRGEQLAILLDNEAISAPVIQSAISTHGQITGRFSMEQAQNLAQVLNAGALPARLKEPPLAVRSIGPTLGETNRRMGLRASYLGITAVVMFMAVYYLWGGLIANLAVAMNLLFVLGIMATFEATFTLPGVAGLILSLGMAVDANVLIFERIREEQARGLPIRLVVRNGYDRAWTAILDSNVTTLITCAILYYFGSEEIKGFALTLGLGILASLFTAVFVTRWVFEVLLAYNLIRSVPMLRLIGVPNIDWWGLRRYFLPVSAVMVVGGLLLYFARDPQNLYDIEFLGGTSAQIELRKAGSMTDEQVRRMVTGGGVRADEASAVGWLRAAAGALERAEVTQPGAGLFQVKLADPAGPGQPDLRARHLLAFLTARDEPVVEKAGIQENGPRSVTVATKPDAAVDVAGIQRVAAGAADYLRRAADRLAAAQVQVVREADTGNEPDKLFEIVTTETSEYIVREAILSVAGEALRVEQAVEFTPRPNPKENAQPYFPIVSRNLADDLNDPAVPLTDVREYMGGVAIVMEDLSPAITTRNLARRLREMRLQPDFEHYAWRLFDVIGLAGAGQDPETGEPLYKSMAVVVTDPNIPYDEDRVQWEAQLAQPEVQLTRAALATERTLRKVIQFAPQIAKQTQQRAFIALALSLVAIMVYVWVRFGTLRHGLGALASLFHDVAVGMGAVAVAAFVAYSPVGELLLIHDYKVNMTIMAALLTLVGYSLNDTIVVFDRVRENRGRLTEITPGILNASINQTLSRTILTGFTTLLVTLIMYVLGGSGIQGFAYLMTVGLFVGTYSSIAIACPLLLMLGEARQNGASRARKLAKVQAS